MKRQLKEINVNKWYHIKTLEKYYTGYLKREFAQIDAAGTKFKCIEFHKLWTHINFLEHPKTKRLRRPVEEAYEEIGFKSELEVGFV